MRPTPRWIAKLRVILVHPDGRREPGHVAVGKPYVLGDDSDVAASFESHCPVEITGLYSRNHPAIGSGTLSALLDAVRLLGVLLHGFVENGGRVLDAEDGSELDLAALLGPLFCPPPPVDPR